MVSHFTDEETEAQGIKWSNTKQGCQDLSPGLSDYKLEFLPLH